MRRREFITLLGGAPDDRKMRPTTTPFSSTS
jgi:hypothetical protein